MGRRYGFCLAFPLESPRTRRDFPTDLLTWPSYYMPLGGGAERIVDGTTDFRRHSARLFKLGGSVTSKFWNCLRGFCRDGSLTSCVQEPMNAFLTEDRLESMFSIIQKARPWHSMSLCALNGIKDKRAAPACNTKLVNYFLGLI